MPDKLLHAWHPPSSSRGKPSVSLYLAYILRGRHSKKTSLKVLYIVKPQPGFNLTTLALKSIPLSRCKREALHPCGPNQANM